ncbi:hypothetical protein V502_07062 [Pseudogymnoascus sp. VKM F-4520 (FW-2644)]|nr:hypothetical protein V502_07062 [Pseudogymnoascus sp. VKM F-4520 (FW-2644)]
MTSILDSGKYSDLRITCQGRTWKGPQSGVIDLPADEPEIVELMLRFLYEGQYNDKRPTTALTTSDISDHIDSDGTPTFQPVLVRHEKAMSANVKVHIIADKYHIPALNKYARMKYGQIMNQVMDVTWSIQGYRADIIFECSVRCTASVVAGAKGEAGVKGEVKEKGNKRVKSEV